MPTVTTRLLRGAVIASAAIMSQFSNASCNFLMHPDSPPCNAIPTTGRAVQDFVPTGYAVFEIAQGDLSGLGHTDYVVTVQPLSPRGYDSRPMLILFADSGDGLRLVARNDSLAQREGEGGIANWNGSQPVTIGPKTIHVESSGGRAPILWKTTLEFAFRHGDWYLVRRINWESKRPDSPGECGTNELSKQSSVWRCSEHELRTEFLSGRVVDSWTFIDDKTEKTRRASKTHFVRRQPLIRFEDATGG